MGKALWYKKLYLFKGLDDRISIFLECKVNFISCKKKPMPT